MGVTKAKTMLYVHQTDPFIFPPGHTGQHPSQLIGPFNWVLTKEIYWCVHNIQALPIKLCHNLLCSLSSPVAIWMLITREKVRATHWRGQIFFYQPGSLSGYMEKSTPSLPTHTGLHRDVRSSFIYNPPKLEEAKIFFNKWMDKQADTMVYHSAIKRNELYAKIWMNVKCISPGERRQCKGYSMSFHRYDILKKAKL